MIYPTKTALVLRRDLQPWQIANVAAFLTGGLAGTYPEMVGEPYRDGSGRFYTPLVREPVFVYGASLEELRRTHQRALDRALRPAIYIEPMFRTSNDVDNRAAVEAAAADALDFVGVGVHGPRKAIDKVVHAIRLSCPCGEHTVLELEYEASRPDAPGPVDAAPAAEVRE